MFSFVTTSILIMMFAASSSLVVDAQSLERAWARSLGNDGPFSPHVAGADSDTFYVHLRYRLDSYDTNLLALDASTGALRWNVTVSRDPAPDTVSQVELLEELGVIIVVLGQFNNSILALNRSTGTPVWNFSTSSYPLYYASPSNKKVILAGNETVIALDPATGSHLWYGSYGRFGPLLPFNAGYTFRTNRVGDDFITITVDTGYDYTYNYVYVLDATDGQIVCSNELGVFQSIGFPTARGNILITQRLDFWHIFNLKTCTQVGTISALQYGYIVDWIGSYYYAVDTSTGYLIQYSKEDGSPRWRKPYNHTDFHITRLVNHPGLIILNNGTTGWQAVAEEDGNTVFHASSGRLATRKFANLYTQSIFPIGQSGTNFLVPHVSYLPSRPYIMNINTHSYRKANHTFHIGSGNEECDVYAFKAQNGTDFVVSLGGNGIVSGLMLDENN